MIAPQQSARSRREKVLGARWLPTAGAILISLAAAAFILFANRDGTVQGVDESSGETAPDPIYVLIERSNGTILAQSNTVTVRGR